MPPSPTRPRASSFRLLTLLYLSIYLSIYLSVNLSNHHSLKFLYRYTIHISLYDMYISILLCFYKYIFLNLESLYIVLMIHDWKLNLLWPDHERLKCTYLCFLSHIFLPSLNLFIYLSSYISSYISIHLAINSSICRSVYLHNISIFQTYHLSIFSYLDFLSLYICIAMSLPNAYP